MVTRLTAQSGGHELTLLVSPPKEKPTIVLCHGFPGYNRNDETAHALAALGYGTVLFRYRGVDGTPGTYSFRGNEADILAVVAATRAAGLDRHGLGLLGYSLGGYHASRLMALHPGLADFLVLMAPLTDFERLRQRLDAFMPGAFRALMSTGTDLLHGDPMDRIREAEAVTREEEPVTLGPGIRAPTLLLHGLHDAEVPIENSERLFEVLPGPAEIVRVAATHDFRGLGHRVAAEVDQFYQANVLTRYQ
ncbi:MAG TPA: alpha/beta fold hydrolase [Candidatus Thermoplasmatota archaeon]|nr:alpha/beta fold hydrolase [Candidatus Thermoplasmatota archaeon]